MAIYCRRVLDRVELRDGDTMSLADALNLSDYNRLAFALTVHSAGGGEAPRLVLEQAITNELELYTAFATPVAFALDEEGVAHAQVEVWMLQWLRWTLSGRLDGVAIVTLDLLARS